ncbi:MAG: hypothetical protein ACI4WY_08430 [Anaerovoracaceae bacterium]
MNESEFLKETEETLKWYRHLENHFHKAADSLPGYVLIRRNIRGKQRYYYKKPGSGRQYYINKKNIALLRQLQQKRIAAHVLSPLRKNIRLLNSVLKEYRNISEAYDAYFPDEWKDPASSKKTNTSLSAQAASIAAGHPEDLRHLTSFGLRVRSKSEAILAELLYSMHIPFTYEKPLRIKGADGRWRTVYPDFTFQLPDGREIYLEHFGMMNDPAYREVNLLMLPCFDTELLS